MKELLSRKEKGLDSLQSRMQELEELTNQANKAALLAGLMGRKDEVETEFTNLRSRYMSTMNIQRTVVWGVVLRLPFIDHVAS